MKNFKKKHLYERREIVFYLFSKEECYLNNHFIEQLLVLGQQKNTKKCRFWNKNQSNKERK